ncbi:uncharacterized protein RSE6_05575 [Rhynchosporium secalis]|uniref:Uncharacterized protein n=1 Tax=Rhynchosporium secalis TaxID=38038 RepID=A0A1E1M850_RHYSE|nr:uncharacterized protein RSE6_05575 [Rhynchosporium secalis]
MASRDAILLSMISDISLHSIRPLKPITSFQPIQPVTAVSPYGNTSNFARDDLEAEALANTIELFQSNAANGALANGTATDQCRQFDLDIPDAISLMGENDLVDNPEQSYNMTARTHDTSDPPNGMILERPEKVDCLDDCSSVKRSCPYQYLLVSNGNFTLPMRPADTKRDVETWSSAATICDEDHDDLQTVVKDNSSTGDAHLLPLTAQQLSPLLLRY